MTGLMEWSGLLAATAVLLALAWWCSRLWGIRWGRGPGKGRIQLLEQIPLGGDKRLVLVRYREKELLLGVSQGGIRLLASSPQPPEEKTEETVFAQSLLSRLEQWGGLKKGKGDTHE